MMNRYNRRAFLKRSALAAAGACCAAAFGPLAPGRVVAQTRAGNGRTVVFLNQFGGCDPLNTFAVPYSVSAYYDRRPTLAIPQGEVLITGNGIGLHPALQTLHQLYLDVDCAIVQGIGDPVGTRSHFTSQEIFSRGSTELEGTTDQRGWIGRMGDLYFEDIPFNTLGIGVGQLTDMRANRTKNLPIVTSSLSGTGFDYDYTGSGDNEFRAQVARAMLTRNKTVTARQEAMRKAADTAYKGVERLGEVAEQYSNVLSYPNSSLARFLRETAMVAEYGLGTKVIYGGIGGWDTHSNQASSHNGLMNTIDQALAAFVADLKRMGKWDSTILCIFTEFGRKTFENGSGGTDHGWGGAMVIIGGGVRGGVYGERPSMSEIRDQNWLYMDIDFRNVFSRLVNWLGYNPDAIFTQEYSKVNLPIV
jgi:uncharacterized protein (DUF1501 family)